MAAVPDGVHVLAPSSPAPWISAFRAWVARQDLTALTDEERLDLLSELELLTRAVGGVSVRSQVSFHASQVAAQIQDGVAPSRAGRAVPDDLAQVRRTSPYWGSRELTSAKALVGEMPCTLAALDRGDINLYQSRLITEATTCLDPADRAEVDRRLAPSLAGASSAEIGAALRGLVYEVDPKGFVERARKAAKDRGVSIRPCPDVMALLSARLPAPLAIACHRSLKDKAVSMQASGDPRSLAQLMADILFERLTGRSVVDGVDVEVGVVITDSALFDGTSEAADLVGYGPIPAEMARDLLRPESSPGDEAAADPDAADDHSDAADGADDQEQDADESDAPHADETDAPHADEADDPRQDAAHTGGAADAAEGARADAKTAEDAPDDADTSANTDADMDSGEGAPGVCPDGIRCTSWSCSLLHGSPEALRQPPGSAGGGTSPPSPPTGPDPADPEQSAETHPPAPSRSDAGTRAAKVWLRRLWSDPATGVLTGRDTRKRLFTGSLRAALIARDKTCRNTWCGAPIRAIDHKVRARDGGPTSDTNGQGLCQRCNNARERPRATTPGADDYRQPPPVLPAFLTDRAPPSAA